MSMCVEAFAPGAWRGAVRGAVRYDARVGGVRGGAVRVGRGRVVSSRHTAPAVRVRGGRGARRAREVRVVRAVLGHVQRGEVLVRSKTKKMQGVCVSRMCSRAYDNKGWLTGSEYAPRARLLGGLAYPSMLGERARRAPGAGCGGSANAMRPCVGGSKDAPEGVRVCPGGLPRGVPGATATCAASHAGSGGRTNGGGSSPARECAYAAHAARASRAAVSSAARKSSSVRNASSVSRRRASASLRWRSTAARRSSYSAARRASCLGDVVGGVVVPLVVGAGSGALPWATGMMCEMRSAFSARWPPAVSSQRRVSTS